MNLRRMWKSLIAQEAADALESERLRARVEKERREAPAPGGDCGATERAPKQSNGNCAPHNGEAAVPAPSSECRAHERTSNQSDRHGASHNGEASAPAQSGDCGATERAPKPSDTPAAPHNSETAEHAPHAPSQRKRTIKLSAHQRKSNRSNAPAASHPGAPHSGAPAAPDLPAAPLRDRARSLGARLAEGMKRLRLRRAERARRRRIRRARARAELKTLTREQRRQRRRRRLKRAGLWALGIAGAGLAALALLLDVGSWSWLDAARLTELRQTTLMYDGGDAEVAGMYLGENRLPVDVSALPEHVRMAFVAAEDARFFSHHGIDLWRIGGAVLTNLKSGGYAQGASTISQQLIKLTHLTAEKTLSRKANEAVLALVLEARYSKEEILGMYMNTVYFGHGAYGIEAAARAYFSKGASELTVAESALMAAVIKSPSGYAPHIAPEKAQKRRDWVLGEMERLGFISPDERAEAQASAIALNESHGSLPEYGWYIDYALGEAEQALGLTPDELLMGGYRIYTELDAALQSEAQRIFDAAAFPADGADGTRCQGALCAVENGSGAIRALVGGREYEVRRGLNRATDVRRQPGSAIKPLTVYAPAVDKFGYLPTSFLSDVPTDFDGWSPRNAGDRYRGIVTLRQTAMSSINVATVELLSRIGVKAGMEFLHSVGIETDPRDEVLPLALGAMTYGVSPLELCGGYSALASGGVYRQPYAVRRILDARGRVVYEHDGGARRVMSEQSAYIMTSMLKSTASRGTASRLSALGAEVAAKTGTAALGQGRDGNRDIWLAAYTPGISVSVWMGFDRTGEDCHLAASASGSNQPTRLALEFLGSEAAAPYVGGSFARPAGLREVMIDGWALQNLHSVLLAGESTPAGELMREIFTPGALPGRVSTLFDEPLPAYDVSAALLESGSVRIEFTCPQEFVQYRVYRLDGEERVLVGTLAGEVGQRLTLTDTGAPDASRVRYDVAPYAPAQDAEGLAATVVLERTLWDELGRWFAGPARQPSDTPAPTDEQPGGGYAGAEQAGQPDAASPAPAAEPTPAPTVQREQGQPVNPFAIG